MFLQPYKASRRRRRASRGFTLIELVVVVLIIGITAALATPGMTEQIRERRSRDVAQRIAQLYSGARMRALGRNAAVLVRYRAATGFTVLESIQGAAAAASQDATTVTCAAQAGLGCLANNWGDATLSRLVEAITPTSEITVRAKNQASTAVTQMDICFTPMGRSFVTFDDATPPRAMVGATTVDVQRLTSTGNLVGLVRTVAILPNGMARLGL